MNVFRKASICEIFYKYTYNQEFEMRLAILLVPLTLAGCATANHQQLYYDAVKSVSKDNTMAQTACWGAVSEIAKGGDNTAKVNAISLAEKCKKPNVDVHAPKKNILGF
jgi:hypothetical protein